MWNFKSLHRPGVSNRVMFNDTKPVYHFSSSVIHLLLYKAFKMNFSFWLAKALAFEDNILYSNVVLFIKKVKPAVPM